MEFKAPFPRVRGDAIEANDKLVERLMQTSISPAPRSDSPSLNSTSQHPIQAMPAIPSTQNSDHPSIPSIIITTDQEVTFPLPNSYQRVSASTTSTSSTSTTSRTLSFPTRKKLPAKSLLEWSRLTFPTPTLTRFTPSQLLLSTTPTSTLMALSGKVYDVSQYLAFHPGGGGQVLRGAGVDATALFQKAHPWVNVDGILGKVHVGYLIPERSISSDAVDRGE